jgi:membrane protein implicated in regulation of membrane protease activity
VDVVTEGELIDQGASVRVIEVEGARVVVREVVK